MYHVSKSSQSTYNVSPTKSISHAVTLRVKLLHIFTVYYYLSNTMLYHSINILFCPLCLRNWELIWKDHCKRSSGAYTWLDGWHMQVKVGFICIFVSILDRAVCGMAIVFSTVIRPFCCYWTNCPPPLAPYKLPPQKNT